MVIQHVEIYIHYADVEKHSPFKNDGNVNFLHLQIKNFTKGFR